MSHFHACLQATAPELTPPGYCVKKPELDNCTAFEKARTNLDKNAGEERRKLSTAKPKVGAVTFPGRVQEKRPPGPQRKRSSSLDSATLNRMRANDEGLCKSEAPKNKLRKVSSVSDTNLSETCIVNGLMTTTLCSTEL